MWLLNPYQLPVHGRPFRSVPTLSDCTATTSLPSRDEALSFHSGVLNGYSKKLSRSPRVTEDA
jgi:hypothetical protein